MPNPIILIRKRKIDEASALTWLGMIACMAEALAPIGDAIKKAGIKSKAITATGLLIKGIKQETRMPVAEIIPTLIRPLPIPLFSR